MITASAALALTGCSLAVREPARELELEVPVGWAAEESPPAREAPPTAAGAPQDRWWESFEAAQLTGFVEEALGNNYDLRATSHRLRQAEVRARIAGAELSPQISAGLNASRGRRNFIGFPIFGGGESVLSSTSSNIGVSLDISWEADVWGRIRAGREAAASDRDAARWDVQGAQLSLAGQTAKAWFALVEARQQVRLAEKTLESRTQTREKIERRYQLGLRGGLDLRLARSNEAAAEATLTARLQQEDGARRQLEILLGRYPGGSLEAQATLPPSPGPVQAGLPAELIARRPDLRATDRRLAGAGARVAQARAALYPALRLTGSGGRTSEELGDLLSGDFSVWSLASGLLQPIFQGGRLRAGVELASASADEALALYAQAALRAFSEVEGSLAAEGFLRRREAALERAVHQATAAQKTAERRYSSGLAEYLEVLESQRQAFQFESQLLEVRRLRLTSRVDLYLALGGGFPPASESPKAPS